MLTAAHAGREPATLVFRDEVLDGRSRIHGYRFRTASSSRSGPLSPRERVRALREDNLIRLVEKRMAVVPISIDDWRSDDFRQFVSPNTYFHVERPPPRGDFASWHAGLRDIKASGGRIALDCTESAVGEEPALNTSDLVFIQSGESSLEGVASYMDALRGAYPDLRFVADSVKTWPEYRTYSRLGVHYCLGQFTSTSEADAKADPHYQARLLLLDMLGLLRQIPGLSDMIALRYPSVIAKVMDAAPHPFSDFSPSGSNIDEPRLRSEGEELYRRLAIAVLRHVRNVDNAKLQTALHRARLLELLGLCRLPKEESDDLFLLGLMSQMDGLLGIPMTAVVEQMPLSPGILEVLLQSQGKYAQYFMVALALEHRHAEWAHHLASELRLDLGVLAQYEIAARTWAAHVLEST